MRTARADVVPLGNANKPDAIVVVSAHWESVPIQITSSANTPMLYDYSGFPAESYEYQYPAPGSPSLAHKIKRLLADNSIESELNDQRGSDHGVFVPLMLMYPEADVPVVAVSLHSSLSPDLHLALGAALAPLRDERNVLLLGSGYTFHNIQAFFHPSEATYKASSDFDAWLKDTLSNSKNNDAEVLQRLKRWEQAPGARIAHPREEHLLPLLVTAAAAAGSRWSKAEIIYETEAGNGEHAVSSYLFP